MTFAKPITHAFITVAGDPAVGIPHARFTAELHLDPVNYAPEDWPEIVRQARRSLERAYRDIHGEPATVTFDFELDDRATREQEATFGTPSQP